MTAASRCRNQRSSSASTVRMPQGGRGAFGLGQLADECPVCLQFQHFRFSLSTGGCGHFVDACV